MRRHYPDDITTLVILGHLHIAAHRYTKAVETFNTAILIHPDNFISHDETIDTLIQNGDLQEALDELDVLLAEQPERADLIARQADILSMPGSTRDPDTKDHNALR